MGAVLIGKSVGEIVFLCQPNGDAKMLIEDVS
jgi:transcription elongation GreA/GreB family factor